MVLCTFAVTFPHVPYSIPSREGISFPLSAVHSTSLIFHFLPHFLGRITAIASESGLLLHGVVSSVCLSVCLSVTFISSAETAEPMEKLLAAESYGATGPRNHVLDEVQIPQGEWAILGLVRPIEQHWESLLWCTQKRLNRSRCRLGADLCGSKEACIRQGQPRILNAFAAAAMRLFVKILWPFVRTGDDPKTGNTHVWGSRLYQLPETPATSHRLRSR